MEKAIAFVDDSLFRFAHWIIVAAAFFGISRLALAFIWVWLSAIIYSVTLLIQGPFVLELMIFSLLLAFSVFIGIGGLGSVMIMMNYREDDVLPTGLSLFRRRFARIFWLLFFPTLYALLYATTRIHNHERVSLVNLALLLISPMFWIYLCFNQSPKNPARLRLALRGLARSVKALLRPSPRRGPEPAHFDPSPPLPV